MLSHPHNFALSVYPMQRGKTPLKKEWCPGYDTELCPMVGLHFWSMAYSFITITPRPTHFWGCQSCLGYGHAPEPTLIKALYCTCPFGGAPVSASIVVENLEQKLKFFSLVKHSSELGSKPFHRFIKSADIRLK